MVDRQAQTGQLRDRHGASRAVAYLMLASSVFLLITGTLLPKQHSPPVDIAVLGTAAVTAVGCWICWRRPELPSEAFWIAAPFIATVLMAGLHLLTRDSGVGAQVFFLWPVLYAATFLSRRLNYAVMATVAVGESAVVFTLSEAARALSDALSMMTALSMAAVVVVTLRERREALRAPRVSGSYGACAGRAGGRAAVASHLQDLGVEGSSLEPVPR